MNANKNLGRFYSTNKLNKAVVSMKAGYVKGTLRMVRPVFRPLEEDLMKSLDFTKVAYEDDTSIAIVPPDMQVNLSVSTELSALKDLTPLDKAKLELFKRDEDALVISLDTEYHEDALNDGTKRREILSYQVSCYYGGKVLRLIIFSKSDKLLSLAQIVNIFYKSPIVEFSLPKHRYPIQEKTIRYPSGKTVICKDYPKGITTYVLAHNALADLTALEDFTVFYKCLTSSLDIITKESYKTHFTVGFESNYYSCLEVKFIGTMNHSPGPLKDLGATKGIDILKIELDSATYEDMTSYRHEHFQEFCAYGINDADIILKWYLTLFKDMSIPATTTSMAAKLFQYFAFDAADERTRNELTRAWRGVVQQKQDLTFDAYFNGVSYRFSGEKGVTQLADEIDIVASATYFGGLNSCMVPGFYDEVTYDYDLCGAYPTAGAMLTDIDFFYEVPLEIFQPRSELDPIKAKLYPYTAFGFGTVDFEFPQGTKHPCIFVKHPEHGLIATLRGTNVCCTWCEVKTAYNMGAKIVFKNFKMYASLLKEDENGHKVALSSCARGYKSLIQNRELTKNIYGKKSLMEITAKLVNNGVYGKMGQSVQSKTMRNIEYNVTEEKPPSMVSSAPHASYTTALVRCILCATMEQLERKGFICYSVTTDGFITNAPEDVLKSCDAFGLYRLFQQSRAFLLDNPDEPVWECKHQQKYLLNITTRMNQGFDDMSVGETIKNKTVDAHVGYKGDDFPSAYLERSKTGIDFEMLQLPSLQAICYGCTDYVGTKLKKNIKANYDFKRYIDVDSLVNREITFRGNVFTVPNFQTKPYDTYEDYLKACDGMKHIRYSILTAQEYKDIFNAMMTGTCKKRTTLKKQIDACLYHIRQNDKAIPWITQAVNNQGLQKVLGLFNGTLKKSYQAYVKYHKDFITDEWDYSIDKGLWRHLSRADRFRPENYTDLSEWLEKALIHKLRKLPQGRAPGKEGRERPEKDHGDLKQAMEKREEIKCDFEI